MLWDTVRCVAKMALGPRKSCATSPLNVLILKKSKKQNKGDCLTPVCRQKWPIKCRYLKYKPFPLHTLDCLPRLLEFLDLIRLPHHTSRPSWSLSHWECTGCILCSNIIIELLTKTAGLCYKGTSSGYVMVRLIERLHAVKIWLLACFVTVVAHAWCLHKCIWWL